MGMDTELNPVLITYPLAMSIHRRLPAPEPVAPPAVNVGEDNQLLTMSLLRSKPRGIVLIWLLEALTQSNMAIQNSVHEVGKADVARVFREFSSVWI